jgi:type I site-specific restriction-modification system R (restriction) subunit
LIRRFLATRNAERVLFVVDRIELAKQTMEEFEVILAEYKPVVFKTARRRPGEARRLLQTNAIRLTFSPGSTEPPV